MAHRVAPRASDDLDDIWSYVADQSGSFEIADRLIHSITDRFFLLADFPQLGRSRAEDLGVGMRSHVVGDYVIIYSIDGGDVLILRVVHGRRDLESIFGD